MNDLIKLLASSKEQAKNAAVFGVTAKALGAGKKSMTFWGLLNTYQIHKRK